MYADPDSTLSLSVGSLNNPSNITATGISTSEIEVAWSRGVSGVAKDTLVFRGTNSVSPAPVNTTTYDQGSNYVFSGHNYKAIYQGNDTNVTDSGLSVGGTYYYTLFATNNAYYSSGSQTNEHLDLVDVTWDGDGPGGSWTNAANWSTDVKPDPGDTTIVRFTGSTQPLTTNEFAAESAFKDIIFTNTSAAFTLDGNGIDWYGDIINHGTGTHTVSLDYVSMVNDTGSRDIRLESGGLTFSGGNITNNTYDLHLYGTNGHTLSLGADLQGTGKFIVEEDSIVDVTVAQSFTGNTEIDAGAVHIGAGGSLSSTTVQLGSGATTGAAVLVIIDLAGNDMYCGTEPGIQGAAIGEVSVLLDLAGDDTYDAVDVAQGACLAGVGILIDYAGNDIYRGQRRAQGSAMCGVAFLNDRAGDDSYHAALFAQGFGGPLGMGILDDMGGRDHYYAGGLYLDGYDDTPGYSGWSQGVGAGPRGVANGGIGALLDGGGDDVYECDYFSHGGGYWFGVGIARDFGGDDRRLGSTRLAFDGGERGEKVFLRWGIGWQAHYGLGFTIDDEGDDVYGGNIVGLGFSWDIGVAGLIDFAGNDHYELPSGAQGKMAALGFLFDAAGDDLYGGQNYGGAPAGISYHPLPECGGNFAFSVNWGGSDTYGKEILSDVVLEKGSPGGFLIDRPTRP